MSKIFLSVPLRINGYLIDPQTYAIFLDASGIFKLVNPLDGIFQIECVCSRRPSYWYGLKGRCLRNDCRLIIKMSFLFFVGLEPDSMWVKMMSSTSTPDLWKHPCACHQLFFFFLISGWLFGFYSQRNLQRHVLKSRHHFGASFSLGSWVLMWKKSSPFLSLRTWAKNTCAGFELLCTGPCLLPQATLTNTISDPSSISQTLELQSYYLKKIWIKPIPIWALIHTKIWSPFIYSK